MSGTAFIIILAIFIVLAGSVAVVFFSYKNEIRDAYDAVRHGSQVVNTDAGPIEYADKGAGTPLLSIHGAGGGFDQVSLWPPNLSATASASSHRPVAGTCGRLSETTPPQPRKPLRMPRCWPN